MEPQIKIYDHSNTDHYKKLQLFSGTPDVDLTIFHGDEIYLSLSIKSHSTMYTVLGLRLLLGVTKLRLIPGSRFTIN